MFWHPYRLQTRDQRDMSRIERREVSAERQSLERINSGHHLDSLHVRAAYIFGLAAEFAARRGSSFACLVGDEIVDAARKIGSSDRRKLAKASFDSSIIFAGGHCLQIRISETGKVQVIEGRRLEAFGVAASQSDSILVKGQRHRPGRTELFAESTVPINSKTTGD